ncbi:MAG: DUF2189 domain-containing protein [Acetobacteraceae bacterium]|nr:DUF2189 domain-containing protein [Acetobacteraceae bacterium]
MAEALTSSRAASSVAAEPVVRRIGLADVGDALRRGWQDFLATPTQLVFLGLIYPIVGLFAARATGGGDLMALFWPLVAGLSLMGPVAALGIYEISRRRERGWAVSWLDAFSVLRSPAILSIAALALMLLVLFGLWVVVAQWIYEATVGRVAQPSSVDEFMRLVFHTPEGWRLILFGNAAGFLFAVAVLSLTVVSFPLLLDRDVGPGPAVRTSLRAVATNPVPMAAWGLIVAVLLLLGSLPLFVGLAVAMPVLGHGTWHLYRKVVE